MNLTLEETIAALIIKRDRHKKHSQTRAQYDALIRFLRRIELRQIAQHRRTA